MAIAQVLDRWTIAQALCEVAMRSEALLAPKMCRRCTKRAIHEQSAQRQAGNASWGSDTDDLAWFHVPKISQPVGPHTPTSEADRSMIFDDEEVRTCFLGR